MDPFLSKVPDVGPLASGFRSSNKLNDNFSALREALLNTVSRDGSSPNEMLASLDMNGQRIINLPSPIGPTDPVRLQDVGDYVDQSEALGAIQGEIDQVVSDLEDLTTVVNNIEPGGDVSGLATVDGTNVDAPEFLSNLDVANTATAIGAKRTVLVVTPEAYRTGDILTEFSSNPKRSNTRALQAAINGVSAAGGGTIRLPWGYQVANSNSSTTDNERFAVELKTGVFLEGGSLVPDNTVSTVVIFGTPVSSCNNTGVIGVHFDCTNIGLTAPVKPSGSYQYFGGCGIAQRNGPRSHGVRFDFNTFTFPTVDPYIPGKAPYHSTVTADADGVFTGNYTEQCGGDTYQFNGGHWQISNNYVGESSDGGVAINNGVSGSITGNYFRHCHLGVGGGPYGYVGNTDRTLLVSNNVMEECAVGVNIAWFSLWSNLVTGVTKNNADMTGPELADPNWVMRTPPNNIVISNNHIINCKYKGIIFEAGSTQNFAPVVTNNIITNLGSPLYDGAPLAGDQITGIGVVGANFATIMNNQVRNTVTPVSATNTWSYVISGGSNVTFSENHSMNNTFDIKYENCSLHIGRIYSDTTLNNSVVGAVSILSSPNNIAGSFTAGGGFVVDSSYYLGKNGSNPVVNFDANDYYEYNRVGDELNLFIGGSTVLRSNPLGTIMKLNNGGYVPSINGEVTLVQEAGQPTKVQILAKCNDGTIRYKNITLDNT